MILSFLPPPPPRVTCNAPALNFLSLMQQHLSDNATIMTSHASHVLHMLWIRRVTQRSPLPVR